MKKAMRLRRLTNFGKYDTETRMYELYKESRCNFGKIKSKLMQMELELQHERDLPIFDSLYQLIIDSQAASLYIQVREGRKDGL